MHFLDPHTIITTGGLALIAFIVFAESGLLFGFFFPGDTLLFLAGTLAAQGGHFSVEAAILVITASATLGGQVGYYIGQRAGPRLFKQEDGILFRKEYIDRSEAFYEKHGGKTVMLARFVPVIRTFAPVVAGISNMNYRKFTLYNVIGSVLWGAGVTLLGFFLGKHIPNIDTYIFPIILFVMLASFGPTAYHVLKDPKARQKIKEKLRRKS